MREPDIRCVWGMFSSSGGCAGQALWMHSTGAFCDEHSAFASTARREPICRDPRPVAILCGALTGALDDKIRAVIADYIAHGDPQPLLDLAEQRGLHEGGYGPERYEEWPERDAHGTGDNPHVWLPVPKEEYATRGRRWIAPVWNRCPCGLYEGEHERHARLVEQLNHDLETGRFVIRDDESFEIDPRIGYAIAMPRGPFDA